jgi:hypothetical protein
MMLHTSTVTEEVKRAGVDAFPRTAGCATAGYAAAW